MQAIILNKIGGPNNLKIQNVPDPIPSKNEVLVKNNYIGINFFDICFRKGQYKLSKTPAILGLEACGYIEKIGNEVLDFKVGDRVAYATAGIGAYVEKKAINPQYLVKVPDALTDAQVAGCLFKGLTAHALLNRVFLAVRAKRILIHSVAGGVGHILCQYAKFQGIEIIGTVGSDSKIQIAKSFGCDHVINYTKNNLVEEVAKITSNAGVGIVYDSIGKDMIDKSLQCLWPMGICIAFGESSGNIEKINLDLIFTNSLYFTRPMMPMYKSQRAELVMSAEEIFSAVARGFIRPQITEFDFKDVAKAHKALENRETTGSLVLKC
jgi:NADPH2:quinone reductase